MGFTDKEVIDYAVLSYQQAEQQEKVVARKATPLTKDEPLEKAFLKDANPSLEEIHEVYCRLVNRAPDSRNLTGAYLSFLGFLNPRSQKRKLKKYFKKRESNNYKKVVFTEGDSWLEYPLFIKEITDQLIKNDDYAVYSDAYGGDWIADIVRRGKQFAQLFKEVRPHSLILSGGGNDIVGRENAVQKESPVNTVLYSLLVKGINNDEQLDLSTPQGKLNFGSKCFSSDFDEILAVIYTQYTFLIQKINQHNDRDDFKIILHGYDYAIPTSKKGFGWNPLRIFKPISNIFLNNGSWLKQPLEASGYSNPAEQAAIIYYMIDRFNKTLLTVTKCAHNVYFIDCRNSINPRKGWYNELHPTTQAFEEISKSFTYCIDNEMEKRHLKAVDFI